MSDPPRVGVLGASSLVGNFLLPLLAGRPGGVLAVSRNEANRPQCPGVVWCRAAEPRPVATGDVPDWIALCPIWTVPEHLGWLERLGARRLVALSSTSIDTKADSPDPAERRLATRLLAAEERLAGWADERGIVLAILRSTMIYDGTSDGNVAAIAAVVRRFGWFPLCGAARGLRQPVHAGDVAAACLAAVEQPAVRRCYTLSGGEALPFRDLVVRTCRAHGLPPRTVSLPPWTWIGLATLARSLRITSGPVAGIGRRMNEDLSCGHAEAAADLGFRPRPFPDGDGTLAAAARSADSPPSRPRDTR